MKKHAPVKIDLRFIGASRVPPKLLSAHTALQIYALNILAEITYIIEGQM